jgi:hypothetical protein
MHVSALRQRSQPVACTFQATMAWKRSGVGVPEAPPFTNTALTRWNTDTARESGGCHSDFTALLVRPGVSPGGSDGPNRSDPPRFADGEGRGGTSRG